MSGCKGVLEVAEVDLVEYGAHSVILGLDTLVSGSDDMPCS